MQITLHYGNPIAAPAPALHALDALAWSLPAVLEHAPAYRQPLLLSGYIDRVTRDLRDALLSRPKLPLASNDD